MSVAPASRRVALQQVAADPDHVGRVEYHAEGAASRCTRSAKAPTGVTSTT